VKRLHVPPSAQAAWAYFLDVDGTLIDIAATPAAAAVDPALLALVGDLFAASGGALALVSGRALVDLERHLGSLRIPLVGQHGLERRDAQGRRHRVVASPAPKDLLRARLAPVLARHPQLLLEDKGLSVALHYRAAPQLAAYVHRLMRVLVAETAGALCLQKGKRVVEAKPVGVDKGSAIEALLAEAPFAGRTPVFVGDDLTDEHAFVVVNRAGGLSIKVGPGRTEAHWRLPNVEAVRAWLGEALLATFPTAQETTSE
jgi:trehalose 6-phosphate phosphatase